MSVEFDSGLAGELAPALRELLRASWPEAARALGSPGLDAYLQGALALQRLGRGDSVVASWIEQAPGVARELGADALAGLRAAALQLASKTSGAVIELLLTSAPGAARRLGDAELFADFLAFINQLVAQAPRGVRPLLEHLEPLLAQLSLGGLRRWALWGAHAHRTDYAAQLEYFSLRSREAQAMLQQERKGTLLVDVQRRLAMYLRALWGHDFFMRPSAGDFESRDGLRPFIEDGVLHLPDALDDVDGVPGLEIYRAAAAHAAAHLAAGGAALPDAGLTPLQRALVELVDDARVEALALRRFPGLLPLWARLHAAPPGDGVAARLARLARALLDPGVHDDDALVRQARALFDVARPRLHDNRVALEIGVALARQLQNVDFDARRDTPRSPYRDDNRMIWVGVPALPPAPRRQLRRRVGLMEMVNEVDCELAGDGADEVWILGSAFHLDQEGCTINEGAAEVSAPLHYPEWDEQIQLERPAWVTLREYRAARGDAARIDATLARYRHEIQRMQLRLDALQPQGMQRLRKLEDGDDIDLDAAVDAAVALRLRRQPDPRVMRRSVRKVRDFAILVLLDLSASTNDRVAGQEGSVLDLTCDACVLLADAMAKVGDPFAIHGFCSDGRHDVQYQRFKDFGEAWGEASKSRLAAMQGRLSTRMGAAIRHAGRHLRMQRAAKKLLIVITDGEPADVDVRDPHHLRADAKKAVEAVARDGVLSYCISLDPLADAYVSRIFGVRNATVVDHAQRLPEKLPLLYAGLTR
jgi:hypothetical protein